MTAMELREQGFRVLVEHLGQVATIRFLKDLGWGSGDYTQEREQLLRSVTRQEFLAEIAARHARQDTEPASDG